MFWWQVVRTSLSTSLLVMGLVVHVVTPSRLKSCLHTFPKHPFSLSSLHGNDQWFEANQLVWGPVNGQKGCHWISICIHTQDFTSKVHFLFSSLGQPAWSGASLVSAAQPSGKRGDLSSFKPHHLHTFLHLYYHCSYPMLFDSIS